jgi:hypothetical protein
MGMMILNMRQRFTYGIGRIAGRFLKEWRSNEVGIEKGRRTVFLHMPGAARVECIAQTVPDEVNTQYR